MSGELFRRAILAKLGWEDWSLMTTPRQLFYFGLAILNYKSILSISCSFLSVRKESKETGTVNK